MSDSVKEDSGGNRKPRGPKVAVAAECGATFLLVSWLGQSNRSIWKLLGVCSRTPRPRPPRLLLLLINTGVAGCSCPRKACARAGQACVRGITFVGKVAGTWNVGQSTVRQDRNGQLFAVRGQRLKCHQ